MGMLKIRSHVFQDLIWAVRADAGAGQLGIQLRNAAQKTAAFCLLDLEKSAFSEAKRAFSEADGTVGPMIALENAWWTELQAVQGGILLIGRYGDPALPVITEMVAVDGHRAEVLEIDAQSIHEEANGLLLPSYPLVDILSLHPALQPNSRVALLETGAIVVRAWHGQDENGLALWLEAWEAGTLVLRVCLEKGMEKLNPAPFFVAGRWLVFIRERRELCWVELGT